MLELILGIFGAFLLFYAAVTKFTTFAAITQMGSIQERAMPWSDLSKVRKKETTSTGHVAEPQSASPIASLLTTSKEITETSVSTVGTAVKTSATYIGDEIREVGHKIAETAGIVKREDPVSSVRTIDKIVFTGGVVNMALTAFIAGAWPQYFYLYHTPKALIYICHRWYTFKDQNQHYLLYDFCYWANALVLYYIWWAPHNPFVFQIMFLVANGPLAWSVLAFSQSLIFHSFPHMTSVFIHTSPMILSYALRWYPTSAFTMCEGQVRNAKVLQQQMPYWPCRTAVADFSCSSESVSSNSSQLMSSCTSSSSWDLMSSYLSDGAHPTDVTAHKILCQDDIMSTSSLKMVWAACHGFYLWWVVLYYLWVFVAMNDRIKERGYKTLFDRVISRGPTKFLAKVSKNEYVQKGCYMLVHLGFATFTMFLATIYWRFWLAHFLFVFTIIAVSAWNAAGFYFTVFLNKYEEELRTRRAASVVTPPPPSQAHSVEEKKEK